MSSHIPTPVSPIPKPPPNLSKPPPSSDSDSDDETQIFHDAFTHFSPQDEAALLSESNATKSDANTLFSQKRYSEAISTYDRALASCPNYLDYEVAVLKSNMSACHIHLEEWKAAVDSATEALDNLERLAPLPKHNNQSKKQGHPKAAKKAAGNHDERNQDNNKDEEDANTDPSAAVVEIPSDEDEPTALHRLSLSDSRLQDIFRIRMKCLRRRAEARRHQATWASLTSAEEDYRLLLSLLTSANPPSPSSSFSDLRAVRDALKALPNEINKAKEKEMAEMMGKLKELGNGILKPFGLSTDNFKMVKDEKTGGYSMNFEQGGKRG